MADDLISKESVMNLYYKWRPMMATRLYDFEKELKALPTISEQRTGHWVLTDDDFVYCSECEDSYYSRPIDASWYYCPHCGAKMQ